MFNLCFSLLYLFILNISEISPLQFQNQQLSNEKIQAFISNKNDTLMITHHFFENLFQNSNFVNLKISNEDQDFAVKLKQILEKNRQVLAKGEWILPPLDPGVTNYSFHYVNKKTYTDIQSKFSLTLTGITKYNFENIEVNLGKKQFHFVIKEPSLDFNGEFDTNGQIGKNLPATKKGKYSGTGTNVKFDVRLELTEKDNQMKIKNINIRLNIEKLKVTIHTNGGKNIWYDKLLSLIISKGAPAFVNKNAAFVNKTISKFLITTLDPIFGKYTYQQLIDFINQNA